MVNDRPVGWTNDKDAVIAEYNRLLTGTDDLYVTSGRIVWTDNGRELQIDCGKPEWNSLQTIHVPYDKLFDIYSNMVDEILWDIHQQRLNTLIEGSRTFDEFPPEDIYRVNDSQPAHHTVWCDPELQSIASDSAPYRKQIQHNYMAKKPQPMVVNLNKKSSK